MYKKGAPAPLWTLFFFHVGTSCSNPGQPHFILQVKKLILPLKKIKVDSLIARKNNFMNKDAHFSAPL